MVPHSVVFLLSFFATGFAFVNPCFQRNEAKFCDARRLASSGGDQTDSEDEKGGGGVVIQGVGVWLPSNKRYNSYWNDVEGFRKITRQRENFSNVNSP